MAKKQKDQPQTITINDVEHLVSDLSEEQVALLNHVADLDRKIDSSKFNLDQLSVGREAFLNLLTKSLESEEAEVIEEAQVA